MRVHDPVDLPVHPATRAGLALMGFVLFGLGAALVTAVLSPLAAHAVWIVAGAATVGAARGASVRVRLLPDRLSVRNLWRNYRLRPAEILVFTDLRTPGLLAAGNPALVVRGRRSRVPLHAAMLWAVPDDRVGATMLRLWADRHGIRVDGSVARLADPPRQSPIRQLLEAVAKLFR